MYVRPQKWMKENRIGIPLRLEIRQETGLRNFELKSRPDSRFPIGSPAFFPVACLADSPLYHAVKDCGQPVGSISRTRNARLSSQAERQSPSVLDLAWKQKR